LGVVGVKGRVVETAMASYCRVYRPIMVFPDAQKQEDDLDLSPDDEEEEEEAGVGGEEEEDPYEYDDELRVVPLGGEGDSPGPIALNDDLILEGKQHQDTVFVDLAQISPFTLVSCTELNAFVLLCTLYDKI
jgi:hypothetical protein